MNAYLQPLPPLFPPLPPLDMSIGLGLPAPGFPGFRFAIGVSPIKKPAEAGFRRNSTG
jgi:hypothetical protein